jgi:hypothetical protein
MVVLAQVETLKFGIKSSILRLPPDLCQMPMANVECDSRRTWVV